MRIVGGQWRGRGIHSPTGRATRPTADRVRESVFNILQHGGWREKDVLSDVCVLDAFAGTGALGLEALSRGAAQAFFMEQDRAAQAACLDNIAHLGAGDRAVLLRADALHPPPPPRDIRAGLVFLDPPYGKGMGGQALSALTDAGWVAEDAVCVVEMAKKTPEPVPDGWRLVDRRGYGVALIYFLVRYAP